MSTLLRTWQLANGLKIEIFDDSVGYYGDYSSVKLVIRCKVGVKKHTCASFESHPRYSEVVEVLASEAEYLREITKPGVPGKSLAGVKAFWWTSSRRTPSVIWSARIFPNGSYKRNSRK